MGLQTGDRRVQDGAVRRVERVEGQRRQRLLDVVAQVNGTASLGRDAALRMPLAEQQLVGREIVERGVGQAAPAFGVVRPVKHLSAQGEGIGRRYRIIDVAGVDGDEAFQERESRAQARRPGRAGRAVQQVAVMVQSLGQGHGAKDRDALPVAEHRVVDPAAVAPADVPFAPVLDVDRRPDIASLARRPGRPHQRIDRIGAATVDQAAGRAQQTAILPPPFQALDLAGQQSVAPSVQKARIGSGDRVGARRGGRSRLGQGGREAGPQRGDRRKTQHGPPGQAARRGNLIVA